MADDCEEPQPLLYSHHSTPPCAGPFSPSLLQHALFIPLLPHQASADASKARSCPTANSIENRWHNALQRKSEEIFRESRDTQNEFTPAALAINAGRDENLSSAHSHVQQEMKNTTSCETHTEKAEIQRVVPLPVQTSHASLDQMNTSNQQQRGSEDQGKGQQDPGFGGQVRRRKMTIRPGIGFTMSRIAAVALCNSQQCTPQAQGQSHEHLGMGGFNLFPLSPRNTSDDILLFSPSRSATPPLPGDKVDKFQVPRHECNTKRQEGDGVGGGREDERVEVAVCVEQKQCMNVEDDDAEEQEEGEAARERGEGKHTPAARTEVSEMPSTTSASKMYPRANRRGPPFGPTEKVTNGYQSKCWECKIKNISTLLCRSPPWVQVYKNFKGRGHTDCDWMEDERNCRGKNKAVIEEEVLGERRRARGEKRRKGEDIFGTSSQCEVPLADVILRVQDNRQSDPNGWGIIALRDLNPGEKFVDGEAQYCAQKDEPTVLDKKGYKNDFYIKSKGGGYWQIAQTGDGAFKSNTYFLNESRESNSLPESRLSNMRFNQRSSKDFQNRRLEWVVTRFIKKGGELVWDYGGHAEEVSPHEEKEAALEECKKVVDKVTPTKVVTIPVAAGSDEEEAQTEDESEEGEEEEEDVQGKMTTSKEQDIRTLEVSNLERFVIYLDSDTGIEAYRSSGVPLAMIGQQNLEYDAYGNLLVPCEWRYEDGDNLELLYPLDRAKHVMLGHRNGAVQVVGTDELVTRPVSTIRCSGMAVEAVERRGNKAPCCKGGSIPECIAENGARRGEVERGGKGVPCDGGYGGSLQVTQNQLTNRYQSKCWECKTKHKSTLICRSPRGMLVYKGDRGLGHTSCDWMEDERCRKHKHARECSRTGESSVPDGELSPIRLGVNSVQGECAGERGLEGRQEWKEDARRELGRHKRLRTIRRDDNSAEDVLGHDVIGARVSVYWARESRWFVGTIAKFCEELLLNKYFIEYDDGDSGWYDLRQELMRDTIRWVPGEKNLSMTKEEKSVSGDSKGRHKDAEVDEDAKMWTSFTARFTSVCWECKKGMFLSRHLSMKRCREELKHTECDWHKDKREVESSSTASNQTADSQTNHLCRDRSHTLYRIRCDGIRAETIPTDVSTTRLTRSSMKQTAGMGYQQPAPLAELKVGEWRMLEAGIEVLSSSERDFVPAGVNDTAFKSEGMRCERMDLHRIWELAAVQQFFLAFRDVLGVVNVLTTEDLHSALVACSAVFKEMHLRLLLPAHERARASLMLDGVDSNTWLHLLRDALHEEERSNGRGSSSREERGSEDLQHGPAWAMFLEADPMPDHVEQYFSLSYTKQAKIMYWLCERLLEGEEVVRAVNFGHVDWDSMADSMRQSPFAFCHTADKTYWCFEDKTYRETASQRSCVWKRGLLAPQWEPVNLSEDGVQQELEAAVLQARVSVYWDGEDKWFEGTVSRYAADTAQAFIKYDDGDCEWRDLRQSVLRGHLRWVKDRNSEDRRNHCLQSKTVRRETAEEGRGSSYNLRLQVQKKGLELNQVQPKTLSKAQKQLREMLKAKKAKKLCKAGPSSRDWSRNCVLFARSKIGAYGNRSELKRDWRKGKSWNYQNNSWNSFLHRDKGLGLAAAKLKERYRQSLKDNRIAPRFADKAARTWTMCCWDCKRGKFSHRHFTIKHCRIVMKHTNCDWKEDAREVGMQTDEKGMDGVVVENFEMVSAEKVRPDLGPNTVGSRVSVYWDGEKTWFPGTVTRHSTAQGCKRHYVEYDDGDSEWCDLVQIARKNQLRWVTRDATQEGKGALDEICAGRPGQSAGNAGTSSKVDEFGPHVVGSRLKVYFEEHDGWFAGTIMRYCWQKNFNKRHLIQFDGGQSHWCDLQDDLRRGHVCWLDSPVESSECKSGLPNAEEVSRKMQQDNIRKRRKRLFTHVKKKR